jgi:hypothetical protein
MQNILELRHHQGLQHLFLYLSLWHLFLCLNMPIYMQILDARKIPSTEIQE